MDSLNGPITNVVSSRRAGPSETSIKGSGTVAGAQVHHKQILECKF